MEVDLRRKFRRARRCECDEPSRCDSDTIESGAVDNDKDGESADEVVIGPS